MGNLVYLACIENNWSNAQLFNLMIVSQNQPNVIVYTFTTVQLYNVSQN